jgi:hypothetical protein
MAFLSIMARFGMDATGFKAGIKQVESASKGLSRDLNSNLKGAIAGAFGTAAIVAAGKATLDYAGQIADLSERLGVSTDALQEMDFAARLTGTNLETFTGFLEKLSVSREEALQGNDELRDSFARLGVSLEDLRTKRLEDLTRQIGRAIQGGDVQQLMPALKGVGGRGAGALAPTFRMGLEEAGQQARAANAIISPEDIAALDEAGDKFTALARTMTGLLAPAIVSVIDGMTGIKDAFVMGFKFIMGFLAGFEGAIRGGRKEGEGIGEFIKRAFNTAGETGEREAVGFLNQRTAEENSQRVAREERARANGGGGEAAAGRAAAAQEERILRLRMQIAERELRLLPAAAQRYELEQRIANLKKEIEFFEFFGPVNATAEEEALKAKIEMMKAQQDLDALDVPEPAAIGGPQGDPMVNALERIGGSFGTADTGMTQVRKLDQIHNELRALKQETKNGNNNTSKIAEALT